MRVAIAFFLALGVVACSSPTNGAKEEDLAPGETVQDVTLAEAQPEPGDSWELVPGDGDGGPDTSLDVGAPEDLGATCEGEGSCFLDACLENGDCQSGWCVEHMGQKVCTQSCQEECPAGWACTQVGETGPDVHFICVSNYPNLCRPCTQADDCAGSAGTEDACIEYGESGSFCGGSCGPDGECPWGFLCSEAVTVDGISTWQCVAETGQCPCTATSVALRLFTHCQVSNAFGICSGKRVCTEEGLSPCDAPAPAQEICNGLDDDCDGDVDEPDLVAGDYFNLCDDNNECTDDLCAGDQGCVNDVLDGGACEDGDPCTVADHCEAGTCVGEAVLCDDGNSCTVDLCTETGGCEHPPALAPCDDGDPCTVGDLCQDGACVGTPVECDCQQDADCVVLEDGDLCNGTLVCDTSHLPFQCVVDPETIVLCPEPDGEEAACQAAACDSLTGACTIVPDHEGLPCDDLDACTINTCCASGACVGGIPLNCNDGNPCTDDSCDVMLGCQHQDNDQPCNDGDVCSTLDQCAGGLCLGGPALVCDDGNVCTDDSCDSLVGCVHTANNAPCDDGNACTTTDLCSAGDCVGSGTLLCGDDNPCTDHACHPDSGCVVTLNEAPCDDGDLCTVGDHCQLGECIASGALPCDDGNPCTDDSCAPASGCEFLPNANPCDDGNLCTVDDQCGGGWCLSGDVLTCDDGNACTVDQCLPDSGCTSVSAPDGTPCLPDNPLFSCLDGLCSCQPACAGKECGPDGCGGQCGECAPGSACVDQACLPDGSVPFAGEAWLAVPDDAIVGARTYSFWFYAWDVQASQTILIKKDAPGPMNMPRPVALGLFEGKLRVAVNQDDQYLEALVSAPVQPETWHHVAFQVSPDEAQLFLDGQLVDDALLSGSPIHNEADYTVGAAPSNATYKSFFRGYLYALRIRPEFLFDGPFEPCADDGPGEPAWFTEGPGPFPCNCAPHCQGRLCGGDGCGGSCGACGDGTACLLGACLEVDPQCLAAAYSLAGNGADASGHGHHCQVLGPDAAPDRHDQVAEALAFDGSEDYVLCGDSHVLEETDQFTISLWVNVASATANPLVNKWYSSDTSGRNSYSLRLKPDEMVVSVSNGTLLFDGHHYPFAANLNQWYHLVVTFEQGTVEFFVDGISQGQKAGNVTAIGNVDDPLKFGDWYHAYNPSAGNPSYYPLHGSLDDVRLFHCALSPTDIQALHEAALSP